MKKQKRKLNDSRLKLDRVAIRELTTPDLGIAAGGSLIAGCTTWTDVSSTIQCE